MSFGAGIAAGVAVGVTSTMAHAAQGLTVRVSSETFVTLMGRMEAPLVVYSVSNFFLTRHHYLLSYKGIIFYLKTETALNLPANCEVIESEKIRVYS